MSDAILTHGRIPVPDIKKVKELWLEFGDVPLNPNTECIEEDWHGFPAGTHREDVWHWFEEEFGIPVSELMYEFEEV